MSKVPRETFLIEFAGFHLEAYVTCEVRGGVHVRVTQQYPKQLDMFEPQALPSLRVTPCSDPWLKVIGWYG